MGLLSAQKTLNIFCKGRMQMTNQEIWNKGIFVYGWPCDLDIETGLIKSNSAIEHSIMYEGQRYLILTDCKEEIVYKPDDEATPIIHID